MALNMSATQLLVGLLVAFLSLAAAASVPKRIGALALDVEPPKTAIHQRVRVAPNVYVHDIPPEVANEMLKGLMGIIGDDILADAYFEVVRGKIATIGFHFRDPTFRAARRALDTKYGSGKTRRILGNESCSEIEVTTWHSGTTTLRLAVWGASPTATRVSAVLELESDRLFPILIRQLDRNTNSEGECASQKSWR